MRSPDQTVITVALSEDLKDIIDSVSADMVGGRSQFIRDAVKAKLQAMGRRVPDGMTRAPSRITRHTHIVNHGAMTLNESSSRGNADNAPRKNVNYKADAAAKRKADKKKAKP